MSHCRDFEEALWEAAEGRPLPAEAEAHLRVCESCRAAAQRLAAASRGFEALRAVQAPDPSAAVWQRVARPKRRPAFALAWVAGAVACVVATTFALRHPPVPPLPVPRVVEAPAGLPAGSHVGTPAAQSRAAVAAPPVTVSAGAHTTPAGGVDRVASAPPSTHVTREPGARQPPAPAQTQLAQVPPGGETTVVAAAADDSCSEAAALAYRAIGRALVARFFSGNGETG